MVSRPETGSDPSIGSDRESGRDRTNNLMLVQLYPTYRSSTSSSIQSFIRGHNNTRLITIVIGKFHEWNIPIPTSKKI